MTDPGSVISYGGGVNSTALAVLLYGEGLRPPVVFADPGGEYPETYAYLDYFDKWLSTFGSKIVRLNPGSEFHRGRALKALEDYCLSRGIIPIMAFRWCSTEWKREPVTRWRKAVGIRKCLIAISSEERHRMFASCAENEYPLVDRGIDRAECERIISRAGLELPRKSGCFFCPYQRNSEWRRMWASDIGLWIRANAMEAAATAKMGYPVALRPDGITMGQMQNAFENQQELPLDCGERFDCYMCHT